MNGANLVVIERAGWMNDLILEHGEMKRGLKIFLLSVVGLFLAGSFVCGLGGIWWVLDGTVQHPSMCLASMKSGRLR